MANETLTAESLTKGVAENLAERLGLSSSLLTKGLNSLINVESLLNKLVDPNSAVQSKEKLPVVLSSISKAITERQQNSINVNQQSPAEFQQKSDAASKLEVKQDAVPVLFAGFTPNGLSQIEEKLPEIIRAGVTDLIKSSKVREEQTVEFPGMGIVTGALGVISVLGGVFTLLYGLQTDGPFKGLAKLAGKGMLEVGKILTAPLKQFTSTITDLLINIPLEKIKIFGKAANDVFKLAMKPVAFTTTITGKLLSPLTDLAKNFIDKLIEVPMKLFKSFASSIGNVFGKIGESSLVKTGLGAITDFLPKMLKGLTTVLKKIPIIGTLISLSYAVSRFKSGDYVGGGIDILSGIAAIVPGIGTALSIGLDGLNAFLDMKSGGATAKQTGTKIDLMKGMGDWIAEKIVMLPVIGPAVKAVKHFAAREWKKGLKQLAYVVPVFDAVAAFLGDEDASASAKAFAGTFEGINWAEIRSWTFNALKNVPVIGPLLKAMDQFSSGNYLKGLKQLAYINPAFEMLGGVLGDSEAGTISTEIGKWGGDLVNDLSKWIIDSLSEMIDIEAIKDSILGAATSAWESRPTWLGGNEPSPTRSNEKPTQVKEVGDAKIKPDGGLLVSSPTEGSLFQLSKNDGIVAAPITETTPNKAQQSLSFTKAETILEKIAENTSYTNRGMSDLISGFNNLAASLERAGISLGQGTIINNQQQAPKSTQFAAAATSLIPNYRSFAETSRFVPV